jgi:hypothetical protein
MVKRWFSFFVPGLGAKSDNSILAVTSLAFLLFCFAGLTERTCKAEVSPAPLISPSPVALDPEFLNLPAFEIQWDGVSPKAESKVGDSLPLKIVGIHAANPGVELKMSVPKGTPDLGESGWGIELSPESSPDSKGKKKPDSPDYSFTAIVLKEGQLTLPSLLVQDSSGKSIARTRPFNVQVSTAIRPDDPKPKEAAPAEPPVGLRFPWWVVAFFGVIGASILGTALYFAYRYWLKYRKEASKPLPVPILAEDEEALNALGEVERLDLIRKSEFKMYYFRISEILKAYIGRRYRCDAPECTSSEMLTILESKNSLDDVKLDELEQNFNLLDRVKFTDFIPQSRECVELLAWAKNFVLQTRRPKQDFLSSSKISGNPSPNLSPESPKLGGGP